MSRPTSARSAGLGGCVSIHQRVTVFVYNREDLPEYPFLDVDADTSTRFVHTREDPIDFPIATEMQRKHMQSGILYQTPDVPDRRRDADPQASALLLGHFSSVEGSEREIVEG